MAHVIANDVGYTRERYLALFDEGLLDPEDRVELLEGVIVAMAPPNPPHDTSVSMVARALWESVGHRAAIRPQCSLVVGTRSLPQPDVAVVPGRESDYLKAHPTTALLVVEVAASSLPQDRLTKGRIYAAASIPEYWIVNLRDGCVEVFRDPDPSARVYRERHVAEHAHRLEIGALPGVSVAVADLLPPPE